MGIIKKDLIKWKKKMFDKMVVLDSEYALQNSVFVEEIDKLINITGKKEKQEIKQWEETCDILKNPKIIKGLTNALKDFQCGRYDILEKNEKGEIILTKGTGMKQKTEKKINEMECEHNWHYVGTETFKQQVIGHSNQFSEFICDKCGKTKIVKVEGYVRYGRR